MRLTTFSFTSANKMLYFRNVLVGATYFGYHVTMLMYILSKHYNILVTGIIGDSTDSLFVVSSAGVVSAVGQLDRETIDFFMINVAVSLSLMVVFH